MRRYPEYKEDGDGFRGGVNKFRFRQEIVMVLEDSNNEI